MTLNLWHSCSCSAFHLRVIYKATNSTNFYNKARDEKIINAILITVIIQMFSFRSIRPLPASLGINPSLICYGSVWNAAAGSTVDGKNTSCTFSGRLSAHKFLLRVEKCFLKSRQLKQLPIYLKLFFPSRGGDEGIMYMFCTFRNMISQMRLTPDTKFEVQKAIKFPSHGHSIVSLESPVGLL